MRFPKLSKFSFYHHPYIPLNQQWQGFVIFKNNHGTTYGKIVGSNTVGVGAANSWNLADIQKLNMVSAPRSAVEKFFGKKQLNDILSK